jgi:hypothetical protein
MAFHLGNTIQLLPQLNKKKTSPMDQLAKQKQI